MSLRSIGTEFQMKLDLGISISFNGDDLKLDIVYLDINKKIILVGIFYSCLR